MKNKAFTLAEVLITLTIIGVIAALTIPNLMQKWSDHADVVKVKEAYSILDNAVKMAIADNGPLSEWGWPEPNTSYNEENSEFFGKILSKYLKVEKYCGRASGCFQYGYDASRNHYTSTKNNGDLRFLAMNGERYFGPDNTDTYGGKMILRNGMRISVSRFHNTNENISYSSPIIVDINGAKKPNKMGSDVFAFGLDGNKNTLVPYAGTAWKNKQYCDKSSGGTGSGFYCVYWVIQKENMDYKYRDVSTEW